MTDHSYFYIIQRKTSILDKYAGICSSFVFSCVEGPVGTYYAMLNMDKTFLPPSHIRKPGISEDQHVHTLIFALPL